MNESSEYCKFRRYIQQGNGMVCKDFDCNELKFNLEDYKKEFRDKNSTDRLLASGGRDRAYEDYCKSLEDQISRCKCKPNFSPFFDSLKTLGQRIQKARELRINGLHPWQNLEIEELNEST